MTKRKTRHSSSVPPQSSGAGFVNSCGFSTTTKGHHLEFQCCCQYLTPSMVSDLFSPFPKPTNQKINISPTSLMCHFFFKWCLENTQIFRMFIAISRIPRCLQICQLRCNSKTNTMRVPEPRISCKSIKVNEDQLHCKIPIPDRF